MIDYGRVRSAEKPEEVVITPEQVFVASDIVAFSEVIDEYTLNGFEFNYVSYTKDEYIQLMKEENKGLQEELLDTQSALCEVYELIGGLE